MTTPAAPHARSDVRRATRSLEDRYLGGVAGGLADHLGLPSTHVRIGFVLASLASGFGLLLYAGLWLALPLDTGAPHSSPGLDAATRQGRRGRPGRSRRARDAGVLVALAALAAGGLLLLRGAFAGSTVFWPVLLGAAGVVVLWWQADEAQRERWLDSTGRVDVVRAVVGRGGFGSYARLAVGALLLLSALAVFGLQTGRVAVARDVVVAGALGVAGLALTLGPWLFRLAGELGEERAARVRQQERADVAAHLHDSVLQTLALIQRSAGDAATVARLARAQERELRQWLYGEPAAAEASLAGALRSAAAEVEDVHAVPVDVVVVGDRPWSPSLHPLVLAAREAMTNAAKHSSAPRVDVYAEVGPAEVEVFVRDRGKGFDQQAVPADRLGVRNSIVDRMARHAGAASIRTAPGEGTEVRLVMQLAGEERGRP